MYIPKSHSCPAVTTALQALTSALGAPVEYSDTYPRWCWGNVRGPRAVRGVELGHNWRQELATVRIVYNHESDRNVYIVVDESAPEIVDVDTLEARTEHYAFISAPLRSALAAAKALLRSPR